MFRTATSRELYVLLLTFDRTFSTSELEEYAADEHKVHKYMADRIGKIFEELAMRFSESYLRSHEEDWRKVVEMARENFDTGDEDVSIGTVSHHFGSAVLTILQRDFVQLINGPRSQLVANVEGVQFLLSGIVLNIFYSQCIEHKGIQKLLLGALLHLTEPTLWWSAMEKYGPAPPMTIPMFSKGRSRSRTLGTVHDAMSPSPSRVRSHYHESPTSMSPICSPAQTPRLIRRTISGNEHDMMHRQRNIRRSVGCSESQSTATNLTGSPLSRWRRTQSNRGRHSSGIDMKGCTDDESGDVFKSNICSHEDIITQGNHRTEETVSTILGDSVARKVDLKTQQATSTTASTTTTSSSSSTKLKSKIPLPKNNSTLLNDTLNRLEHHFTIQDGSKATRSDVVEEEGDGKSSFLPAPAPAPAPSHIRKKGIMRRASFQADSRRDSEVQSTGAFTSTGISMDLDGYTIVYGEYVTLPAVREKQTPWSINRDMTKIRRNSF
eukprot:m.70908 g.70908  ORF g.70908 m.70908 type:complete len:494 (-) comp8327_c1_seq1:411-1892(-)